ncbi:MAG TPA: ABC transporter permease [Micromonosporaceae bacterium]
MLRFLVRRTLLAVLTLVAISITTFGLFFAGPANPAASMCGTKSCSAQDQARINDWLGLDRPIFEQYTDFMKGIFVGRKIGEGSTLANGLTIDCPAPCLGVSFRSNEPVMSILSRAVPITVSIVVGAAVVYWLVGIGLGMVSAIRRGTVLDRTAVGFSLTFASMQIFFLGPVLLLLLVYNTDLLKYPSWVPPTEDPVAWFKGMLLPWITLGLINSASYARLSRAQMLETLSEDFIRTARAKGLSARVVNMRHAFRASITPLVTIAGLDLAGQLGGVVITESVFGFFGLGRQAILAVNNLNLPIIMAVVLLAAVLIVVANLIVDMLYAVIDPRVRLS